MKKIGLIAGSGELPIEFIRSAKKQNYRVVAFALEGIALSKIEKEADKTYWLSLGQYKKFAFLLLKERLRQITLLGKVDKNLLYQKNKKQDRTYTSVIAKMKDKKDYSILNEVTKHLKRVGVSVIDPTPYLSHLLPEKGILSRVFPDERLREDIKFGYETAKKVAAMDIGQTIIVKDRNVVSVEAMEGTDAAIIRAAGAAGAGCVMVKVSRPNQDMRWDIPTIGPDTMKKLSENKFSALALESGKTFLVGKEELLRAADTSEIVVQII
ncbi:MAG: UDP-2,3-diacylglucosamine diphosphatase LpxI [Candidatus Omnitrophota bacterium]